MTRAHSKGPTEAERAVAQVAQATQEMEARWPHIRRLVRDLQQRQGQNHFSETVDNAYRERFR